MEEKILNDALESRKKNEGMSMGNKFIIILVTSLILLIPLAFMSGMISDRVNYKKEAVEKVAQSWAKKQLIDVPEMYFKTKKINKDGTIEEINLLDLNKYEATVNVKTEVRKKGIFKIPVYTAEVVQKGDFENKYGNLSGKQISTQIKISDSRGFIEEPSFKINNSEPVKIQDNTYTTDLKTSAKIIPFEITYKIRGLDDISVSLGGLTNNITIQGNWKDPEFKGLFLPTEREVTNKDFKATWSIPKIALSDGRNVQTESVPSYVYSGRLSSYNTNPDITVSLLVPVDSYSMAERSLKYGFLLLALTFAGYFIFELTSKEKKQVHPIQYCLLGAAILMFYLLLVSISELLTFNLAYLISAIMVMGMILVYTYFVITKKQSIKFSIGITASIGFLYAFFYVLLMLQDIALFAGSIGLFIIIAAIMYLTRNVNWYNEKTE